MTQGHETTPGEEGLEGLYVPDTWKDELALLQTHEDRVHGHLGVVNDHIRLHQLLAKTTAKSLVRCMVAPGTGSYPTFHGSLQRPAYMWGLMREVYDESVERTGEAAAIRLGRAKILRRVGVREEHFISQEALQKPDWLGYAAMSDQISYLITVSDHPNITLRVLRKNPPKDLPDITLIYRRGLKSTRHRYGFTVANPYLPEIMVSAPTFNALEELWGHAEANSLSIDDSRKLLVARAQELVLNQ